MVSDLPEEMAGMVARRILWQEYGVQLGDWTFEDIINAIELDNAIRRREQMTRERANRG